MWHDSGLSKIYMCVTNSMSRSNVTCSFVCGMTRGFPRFICVSRTRWVVQMSRVRSYVTWLGAFRNSCEWHKLDESFECQISRGLIHMDRDSWDSYASHELNTSLHMPYALICGITRGFLSFVRVTNSMSRYIWRIYSYVAWLGLSGINTFVTNSIRHHKSQTHAYVIWLGALWVMCVSRTRCVVTYDDCYVWRIYSHVVWLGLSEINLFVTNSIRHHTSQTHAYVVWLGALWVLCVSRTRWVVTYDDRYIWRICSLIHLWRDSSFLRFICLSRTQYVITHHKVTHI